MLRKDSKKSWKVFLIFGLMAALPVLAGCSDDDPDAVTYAVDPAGIDVSEADHCDIIQSTKCLYPFPNDYFTVADPDADTGLMINLSPLGMPVNVSGKEIDPAEWNRNDGFSPGAMILTHVPGIDMDETGAVPLTDIERSLDDEAPILVIDADTGSRHLIWSELDSNATEEEGRALIIRPAKNFQDGQRYIVALRNLRDKEGEIIPPSDAFLVFRDQVPSTIGAFESRRSHMEDVFSRLADAGVARGDLFLAWDFTVASTRNLTGRMLHIRDDAFESLGGQAPQFEIENEDVVEYTKEQDERIGRSIHGRIRVPNYMDTDSGEPGSVFYYDPADGDDLPDRLSGTNFLWQEFTCNIPHVSLDAFDSGQGEGLTRPSLYGHGLLGGQGEVNSSHVDNFANTHNLMFCAVDWLGMSTPDIATVAVILSDLSNFKALADRCQQGMLGFLFLARLLKHDQGFAAHDAFQVNEAPVFDNSDVFYDGNSQGGIMGGALMAVSQDITRGVLGVPGMNYSLLLRRSVDFDTYGNAALYPSYPDTLDRSLLLSLIQMLWDRAEANGYANHMTDDPLDDTPPHKILLQVAFGDHQVTHTSAEIEARTIGARIHMPAAAEGRHHDLDPYYGISSIDEYPFDGSVITIWDGGPVPNDNDEGTPTPPVANLPPREGEDPHERPRRQPDAMLQKSEFLKSDGMVINVCGDQPCFSDGYTGDPVQ